MKNIKKIAAVIVLSFASASTFAASLSVTAPTLDDAEAKIAAQAQEMGASYKVTSAYFQNGVYMTATLTK
ncbi:hypothetical protein J9874_03720 (plasmid) [Duffyella gerundensis]|jgi:outer membrane lipoprotein-sorting protein|uniref:Putative secreted protein n=1 Tax=Duffyella gerundensis TaxID=1619313 RepID=A0A0U5L860_9GAMM|nr:DUF1471 domain-containing protein [Duffyella gerundensis]QTO56223.1 DUF1471 domain-containing protein [Duffyella gerundensis]UCB33137.1 hypothetical protein J9874_03720 [Duffyella gerundensis]CUU26095.1 putative secreted protein [Duffyella gerundensis]